MSKKEDKQKVLELPLWPKYLLSSYRYFYEGEKHISRIFDDFVLLFVYKNSLIFTENGKEVEVKAGHWYIQVPKLLQEGGKGSPSPCYYYIHFSSPSYKTYSFDSSLFITDTVINRDFLDKVLLPLSGTFDYPSLKPLFDRLDSIAKRQPWDIASSQSVFLSILSTLTQQLQINEISKKDLIPQVMDYIAANYKNEITSTDLYNSFHFTSDYLARKMKQYCGITPFQYLQLLRINNAKELLINTDYSLLQIANEIGYSDVSVFYKAFKKHTGEAPGEWRNKNRGLS